MRSELDGPFGSAAVRTAVTGLTLPARSSLPPDALYELLRPEGNRGLAMFQTGDGEGRDVGRRSVLVARPLLRCEVRGAGVTFTPLVDAAAELLAPLGARLPTARTANGGLHVAFPAAAMAPGSSDDEVLGSPSVLDALRAAAGLLADDRPAAMPPGLFGALGYELVDQFEELGPRRPDPLGEPDASLVLAGDIVVWEHTTSTVHVVVRGLPWEPAAAPRTRLGRLADLLATPGALPSPRPAPTPPALAADDDPDFLAGVAALQRHVRAGDVFQAVLSRSVALPSVAPALAVYRALAELNPSPFQFLLELPDGELLGASPETCLRVRRGQVELRPIAGTAPRGLLADGAVDHDLDQRLALALLLDPKEQAEHAMLLDLARNDVARIVRPGTTRVAQLFALEKFARVQHLTSRVVGELRPGLDALHAYRGVANMGTLTGAPKPRAMQLIRALEATARGFYGGAVGWLLQDGSMDTCIAIRCLRRQHGVYHARAGAGVVLGSDPARELLETAHKLRSLREAVAAATAAEAAA